MSIESNNAFNEGDRNEGDRNPEVLASQWSRLVIALDKGDNVPGDIARLLCGMGRISVEDYEEIMGMSDSECVETVDVEADIDIPLIVDEARELLDGLKAKLVDAFRNIKLDEDVDPLSAGVIYSAYYLLGEKLSRYVNGRPAGYDILGTDCKIEVLQWFACADDSIVEACVAVGKGGESVFFFRPEGVTDAQEIISFENNIRLYSFQER